MPGPACVHWTKAAREETADCETNPTTPGPIILKTGAKLLRVEDFATSDHRFVLSRTYRSLPFGKLWEFNLKDFLGLASNWQLNFQLELHLKSFSGSTSSPSAYIVMGA
ncbi:MAG: hypothetical protein ACREJ4_16810, partial [Candidatus Methylomirabilaceae bacterium]